MWFKTGKDVYKAIACLANCSARAVLRPAILDQREWADELTRPMP